MCILFYRRPPHTPHTPHTSCTHFHGHSHTTHSPRRAHTTHTNATKRILQAALWEAVRSHLLTPAYALTRALAHSLTHLLLHSFTPIHFCSVYEKIIFTCGVIRSFDVLRCQGCVFPVDAEFTWECLMGDHLCESRSVACGTEHLHEHGWS